MHSSIDSAGPIQSWLDILDAMGESVSQTLQATVETGQETENIGSTNVISTDADFRRRLDATIQGLEQRLQSAHALGARIESMLDRDEREVRAWRTMADATKQRLAASGQLR